MRVFLIVLSVFVVVFCSLQAAHATVYQYFDEEGTLIVTDNPYGLRRPKPAAEVAARFKPLNLTFKEDVSYDYYSAAGGNFHDAFIASRLQGQPSSNGVKDFAAQTKWTLGWSYRFNSSYRIENEQVLVTLDIADVNFTSDILVTLPNATGFARFTPEDMHQWSGFVQRLLDHEHDHVRIVQDRREWDTAVNRIRSLHHLELPYTAGMNIDAEIRTAVEAETARIGHQLIRTIKERNEEYDRLTMHGIHPEQRDVFFRETGIP